MNANKDSTSRQIEFGVVIISTYTDEITIAFGIPVPAVDGNVLRVVARITGDEGDITTPAMKRRVTQQLAQVIPVDAPGEYNQALMELGATVCLPNGAPLCDKCPAFDFCRARMEERTGELPVKAAKKERRIEQRTVYLIFHENQVALRRRAGKGLLAGLWEYPNQLSDGSDPLTEWGIRVRDRAPGGTGKHIFTHIEWHLKGVLIESEGEDLPEGWVWCSREELLHTYAVPNAFRAFEGAVLERLGYF